MAVPQQAKQILDTIGSEWDQGDPAGHGFTRKRWLQTLSDVVSRPIANRVQMAAPAPVVVNCNGTIQSTGIGTIAILPGKYAETQVQSRVTLNAGGAGVFQVYVMRTTGNIPALGAAPNAGDVIVSGDSFGGGSLAAGVNTPATLAAFDQNLSQTTKYKYYLAVLGPGGQALNLVNNSQLNASEF